MMRVGAELENRIDALSDLKGALSDVSPTVWQSTTMSIRDRIATVLAFRVVPATVIAILFYAAIYVSVFFFDGLPYTPKTLKKQRGLNLDAAYADLHFVRFHECDIPYHPP